MKNCKVCQMCNNLITNHNFIVIIFFSIIAWALLAPLASNKYIPSVPPDFSDHVGAVVQAKQAISEGQFPIRVAPWQLNNLRYPLYQFYSNTPYTVAGLINCLVPNPFNSLKITLWLALVLGGVYIYRMAFLLCRSSIVSLLAGIVYLGAPYFITNIIWRGDFTEATAQGILPLVLFYTYRLYSEKYRIRTFCLAALFWYLLVTSHVITFAYTALFIGFFILLLFLQNYKTWKGMLISGLSVISGMILALWFLAPVLLLEGVLKISDCLSNPSSANWLTSLASLFAIRATPPLQPDGTFSIHCAIGLPIILAVGIVFYRSKIKTFKLNDEMNRLIVPLLILFVLAFFMIWSPFNFWKFLPHITYVVQFSYRLLAQVMWIGALLFVFAIYGIFRGKLDGRHAIVGIFLLCLLSGHWLYFIEGYHGAISVDKIVALPNSGPSAYLFKPELALNSVVNLTSLPVIKNFDGWLDFGKTVNVPYDLVYRNPNIKIQLDGDIPRPLLITSPIKISIKINNEVVATKQFKSNTVFWKIPVIKFIRPNQQGSFTFGFIIDRPTIPALSDSHSVDRRELAIKIRSLVFTDLNLENRALFANNCKQSGYRQECTIKINDSESLVGFPQLYYPKLLEIMVNGIKSSYQPVGYQDMVVAGVKLRRGDYNISANFRGLPWANLVSIMAWLVLMLMFIVDIIYVKLKRRK